MMKSTALLVNMGRGGIVDEKALADAIDNKIISESELDEVKMDYVYNVDNKDVFLGVLYYDVELGEHVWKLKDSCVLYPSWFFKSLKRDMTVEENEEEVIQNDEEDYTFIDLVYNAIDGDTFTNGDYKIKKVGDTFVFDFPNNNISVSQWSRWTKEERVVVDVAEAMTHLLNGKTIESVLSGERYSLNDIDGNNYDSIELEEIMNKWILIE